jgi:indole-3-glycerol phosphate synthase
MKPALPVLGFAAYSGTGKTTLLRKLIPRLSRTDLTGSAAASAHDMVALARIYDEADVPAIAVATAAVVGGSIDDLQRVSEVVSAPVLRDDLCLDSSQVYQARLHGADAVVLPVADLERDQLDSMVRLAASLHMTAIVEVGRASDVPAAVAMSRAAVGLRMSTAGWNAGESDRLRTLADAIPKQRTVILLDDLPGLDAVRGLTGAIDAALVGKLLVDSTDPLAVLRAWEEETSP